MITTSESSTMIAVFANLDQANQSIDNLRHAGYSYDQIRLVNHGTSSFIEDLKGLFTGHTMATTNSADDWMRIGVAEQDARHYQNELNAGRSVVLIRATGSPEQAINILHQSGAYDIAFRLRSAQPPILAGTYNQNVQPETYNPNPQQGTNEAWPQQPPANPQDERRA